eukprot:3871782-Lingulodinium_polyedra.AAC.1
MMRLIRPLAHATAHKQHAHTLHARTRNWRAHGACERAICEALRQQTVDSTASFRNAFFLNAAQWRGRVHRPPPRRLANR